MKVLIYNSKINKLILENVEKIDYKYLKSKVKGQVDNIYISSFNDRKIYIFLNKDENENNTWSSSICIRDEEYYGNLVFAKENGDELVGLDDEQIKYIKHIIKHYAIIKEKGLKN